MNTSHKVRNCIVCGKNFESHNPNPTFCSIKCNGDYQSPKISFEVAKTLYETGNSQIEVGQKLGVSQKTIFKLFKRNNYNSRIAKKRNQYGESNHSWKGDNATYAAFHYRVYAKKGKADRCEECCRSDNGISYDWANQNGSYEDIEDYKMMCRSCHFKKDEHFKNFPNNIHIPNNNARKKADGK